MNEESPAFSTGGVSKDETLISVLRQLRSGYPNRPQGFPHSLALIGVRDVRDYKLASGGSRRLSALWGCDVGNGIESVAPGTP